jgi:hypothetical protein
MRGDYPYEQVFVVVVMVVVTVVEQIVEWKNSITRKEYKILPLFLHHHIAGELTKKISSCWAVSPTEILVEG